MKIFFGKTSVNCTHRVQSSINWFKTTFKEKHLIVSLVTKLVIILWDILLTIHATSSEKRIWLFFSLNVEQNPSEMETCFIIMLHHGTLSYTYSSHLLNDKQICLSTMIRVKVLKPCSHTNEWYSCTFHKRETKSATQHTSRTWRGHVALALTLGHEIFVDWAHLKNTCSLWATCWIFLI
jgi:hypothetical protein